MAIDAQERAKAILDEQSRLQQRSECRAAKGKSNPDGSSSEEDEEEVYEGGHRLGSRDSIKTQRGRGVGGKGRGAGGRGGRGTGRSGPTSPTSPTNTTTHLPSPPKNTRAHKKLEIAQQTLADINAGRFKPCPKGEDPFHYEQMQKKLAQAEVIQCQRAVDIANGVAPSPAPGPNLAKSTAVIGTGTGADTDNYFDSPKAKLHRTLEALHNNNNNNNGNDLTGGNGMSSSEVIESDWEQANHCKQWFVYAIKDVNLQKTNIYSAAAAAIATGTDTGTDTDTNVQVLSDVNVGSSFGKHDGEVIVRLTLQCITPCTFPSSSSSMPTSMNAQRRQNQLEQLHHIGPASLIFVTEANDMTAFTACEQVLAYQCRALERITCALQKSVSTSVQERQGEKNSDILSTTSVMAATAAFFSNFFSRPSACAVGIHNYRSIVAGELDRIEMVKQNLRKTAKRQYMRLYSAREVSLGKLALQGDVVWDEKDVWGKPKVGSPQSIDYPPITQPDFTLLEAYHTLEKQRLQFCSERHNGKLIQCNRILHDMKKCCTLLSYASPGNGFGSKDQDALDVSTDSSSNGDMAALRELTLKSHRNGKTDSDDDVDVDAKEEEAEEAEEEEDEQTHTHRETWEQIVLWLENSFYSLDVGQKV